MSRATAYVHVLPVLWPLLFRLLRDCDLPELDIAPLPHRRAVLAIGWLWASVRHPRLAAFQRRWFTLRRWHVAFAVPTGAHNTPYYAVRALP